MPDTTYIVLQRGGDGLDATVTSWAVVDPSVPAGSAEAAIRKAAQENGVYVAVPGRSFKPVRVQAVQTTTLKLEHDQ